MNDVVVLITELGFPIAAAIGLGMFVLVKCGKVKVKL